MLTFVVLGLWTMNFVRDEAMADPASCHVTASAPTITQPGVVPIELTKSFVSRINSSAPWRANQGGRPAVLRSVRSLFGGSSGANPCGEAADLAFGQNVIMGFPLGLNKEAGCPAIGSQPKTLVANLGEPAILAALVTPVGGGKTRPLGEQILHGMSDLKDIRRLSGMVLTGDELFVTDAFIEAFTRELKKRPLPLMTIDEVANQPWCLPGEGPPLRIAELFGVYPSLEACHLWRS
jgi:hypothetical protein